MNLRLIRSKLSIAALFVGTIVLVGMDMQCPTEDGGAPLNPPPADINTAPRIVITEVRTPEGNDSAQQGELVEIDFTAGDDEDRAVVRVFASPTPTPSAADEIPILSNFQVGPGSASGTAFWPTNTVIPGPYTIFAEISDGTFDATTGTGNRPIRVSALNMVLINPVGTEDENAPPTVDIELPATDAGLTNRDILTIRYTVSDPESNTDTLTARFFFDRDRNSANDASQPPILLGTNVITPGAIPTGAMQQFNQEIEIDLNEIPTRVETDEGGRPIPYFVRVELSDGNNPTVNDYAVGTVRLLRAPSDVVDLQLLGGRTAGVRLQGFDGAPDDPIRGSRAGAAFAPLGDLDGDGLADFAVVSETASPFNNFRVGEVYIIYGRERRIDPELAQLLPFGTGRYAGINSLNTVGSFVPFPPEDPRFQTLFNIRGHIVPQPASLGASFGTTSVTRLADQTGDLRPEVIVGSPLSFGVADFEDDDPCDTCLFDEDEAPLFVCYNSAPRFFPNDMMAEVEFAAAPAAGVWLPFDPATPLMFFPPNADFELENDRIVDIASFQVQITGQRADEVSAPFTLLIKLENNDGPELQVDVQVANFTDDMGMFTVTGFFPVDAPSLPVAEGDPVPPSVYDGIYTVFLRSSAGLMDDVEFTIRANGFTITPTGEPIAIRARYPDRLPNPFSTTMNGDVGLDPLALVDLPVPCPPANRTESPIFSEGYGNEDGQLCDDLGNLIVGCGGPNNDDLGGAPGASGHVYMIASDDVVTPVFTGVDANGDGIPDDGPAGTWTGLGIRRPRQVLAGQAPGGGYRGARIRGAWSHPAGQYDPFSLLGYTVDTIPDMDTVFSPDAELLVSAPAGGVFGATSTADLTAGLGGEYTRDPNGVGTIVDATVPFDVESRYSDVIQASLFIIGEAESAPILRFGLDNGNGGYIGGTVREALLWGGPVPSGDDDQAPTLPPGSILGATIGFAQAFDFPQAGLQLLMEGVGTLRIEIAEDCAAKFSKFRIDSVELRIDGLLRDVGYVRVYEGDDYSNDEVIEPGHCPGLLSTEDAGDMEGGFARPMSWPSIFSPCPVLRRDLCDIVTVADIFGEAFGDSLGFARNGGDLNLDGVVDIACGSPGSDSDPFDPDLNCNFGNESNPLEDNGKSFIIFGTPTLGDGRPCDLPERIEIRGSHVDDQFGRVQGNAGDIDGDGNTDVYVGAELYDADNLIGLSGSPRIDAGFVGVLFGDTIFPNGANSIRPEQIGTNNFPGVKFIGGIPGARLSGGTPGNTTFVATEHGQHGVASAGDFNRDGNEDILMTAPGQTWPSAKIEFNGPVADGDRVILNTGSIATPRQSVFEFDFDNSLVNASAIAIRPATNDALAAQTALINAMVVLDSEELGISAVTSRTNFPDPLPDIPTVTFLRRLYTPDAIWVNKVGANIAVTHVLRQGVAYLVFGDQTLLRNKTFELPQDLNRRSNDNTRVLKGVVFVSGFEKNSGMGDATPDEAPIETVSVIGDIDGDGFVDIILGAPQADLINIIAPSERRQAAGEAYLIYGNSFGLNDSSLP